MPKTKVLICATAPLDSGGTRSHVQFDEIRKILKDRGFDVLDLVTTFEKLNHDLSLYKPSIVHFIGHASKKGFYLENKEGRKTLITTKQLIELFKKYSESIQCVFLNACNSDVLAEKTASYVDCAIGIENKVDVNIAINLAKLFYEYLVSENNKLEYKSAFNHILNCMSQDSKALPKFFDKKNIKQSSQQESSPYLQIELFLKNKGGETYTFKAWFYDEDIYTQDNITLNKIPELLDKTLDQIDSNLESNAEPLTIEFFLSQDLLNQDIEYYCLPNDHIPIGRDYKIIIRSWERLRKHKSAFRRCRLCWNKKELPKNFIFPDQNLNIIFDLIIDDGMPILIWFRKKYSEKILQELEEYILKHEIGQLPEAIYKIRAHFWKKSKKQHIGHLSLLWEDMSRVPPDVMNKFDNESYQESQAHSIQNRREL
ncbi:hypothetical protein [Candidatus Albibeggiatoa sp. nov. NOAA]|uniref:VMAP-C domain-containing protein n=1 Tax=Candidatus Albibeggiatoa sp. nov. NOAA TaxID=3162724 RepID=UPI0032F99725|nr:CHAT domain-containing protein [Thiotrichaceae bacterium]